MTLVFRAFLLLVLSISGQLFVEQPAVAQQNLTMEQAVAIAERFIRENGYTDAPAEEIKAQLDFESLEFAANVEELLRRRRNTLQPKAFGAKATSSGWGVAFDYFKPQADQCRVVEMRHDGGDIRVMHQSGIREYWVGFKRE